MNSYSKKVSIFSLLVFVCIGCDKVLEQELEQEQELLLFEPQMIEDFLIFENGNFLSFTDLIDYNGKIYCVFREGEAHVSDHGFIQIIKKSQNENWETEYFFKIHGYDLRDPQFLIDFQGNLCVHFAGVKRDHDGILELKNYIAQFSLNKDKLEFQGINEMSVHGVNEKTWLWRITKHENKVYGVSYNVEENHKAFLLFSEDYINFYVLTELTCEIIPEDQYITEAFLEFSSDHLLRMVARVDSKGGAAVYGISHPPYIDWEWHSLGVFLGGPILKTIYDKTYVAGRSFIENKMHTTLFELDTETSSLKYIWHSEYFGDTGYPGIVYKDEELLMSFYAQPVSELPQSNIYLMKYW